MNDWERQHRLAQQYKQAYPPGTRLMLLSMHDPYRPVESGTRGTVEVVDDIGTIHMNWDIYTPDVLVFKTDTRFPELMEQEDWMQVNVITCAAPNLRTDKDGKGRVSITDSELEQIHIKRMRRILSIVASRGNDVVILGAFGCGAFKNSPEVVARAMKKVVQEFRNYFEVIEFAVYCSPRDEQNYTTFKRILGKG